MKLPRIISSLPVAAAAPTPPVLIAPTSPDRPHLVLHFDINETILVGDEAGGDTREDCLNKMICKSAFVLMNDGQEMDGDDKQPSMSRRALAHTKKLSPSRWWNGSQIKGGEGDTSGESPPPLYTGWEWPPNACPYYRTTFKKRAKSFTLNDGAAYRPLYHELEKRIAFLPDDVRAPDGHEYPHALHHMLPAFFHTLYELKQSGRSFGLVLRTFGSDLPDIAEALNVFARGEHPLYKDFRDESLILTRERMFRGRWREKNGDSEDIEYQLLRWSDNDEEATSFNDGVVASGDAELLNILEHCTVAGVQDHYSYWDENNNAPWAGKPIWTHRRPSASASGKNSRNCHHIFFDDNIHNDGTDSIAAVRVEDEEGTYKSLSGEKILEIQGLHLIKVPTVAPVLEKDWFLHRIREAEERLDKNKHDI
jgi:hypothetical protein